ncbi:N-acetyltransferase family protein [Limibacillus sp. MBR-115]|jgi:phosphinothricin acetyltransferase|uniref:GNAT family N-acetyltransferase n=1 Tax=Limibacillus sp. MBR-115 TaxID=3156465 RepID=UPI00339ACF49
MGKEKAGIVFTLRAAASSDLEALLAIYAHHVRHGTASFELEPPTLEDFSGRFKALQMARYPYILAVTDDGRVLGYAYAGPYRPRPAYRYTVEDSVYVAPEAAGKGVGGALLDRLIELADEQGYRKMVAVIGDSLQVASIALHAGRGFVFAGTVRGVGYKHGRWLDQVLMERDLGPGNLTPPDEGPNAPTLG